MPRRPKRLHVSGFHLQPAAHRNNNNALKFLWSVTSMVCVESKRLSRSVRCLLILAAPEGQKAVRGPPPRVVKDLDPPGSLAAFVLGASERSQRHICYSWTQLIAECMRWGNVCTLWLWKRKNRNMTTETQWKASSFFGLRFDFQDRLVRIIL